MGQHVGCFQCKEGATPFSLPLFSLPVSRRDNSSDRRLQDSYDVRSRSFRLSQTVEMGQSFPYSWIDLVKCAVQEKRGDLQPKERDIKYP